jgi:hypothetical protein
MIPKSGNRFSEKIVVNLVAKLGIFGKSIDQITVPISHLEPVFHPAELDPKRSTVEKLSRFLLDPQSWFENGPIYHELDRIFADRLRHIRPLGSRPHHHIPLPS